MTETERPQLTPKQAKVLKAIQQLTAERNGLPPSIREIQQRCQFRSPNGVICHLHPLESKGYIVWEHGVSRGVMLKETAEKSKYLSRLSALDVERLKLVCQLEGV